MTIQSQPPVDVSISPPSVAAMHSRRYRLVILSMGLISVFAIGWTIVPRAILKHHRKMIEEAMQNGRFIGMALEKFQSEYGQYPDATTGMLVTQRTGVHLPLVSGTSNDYLRQLIAADPSLKETTFRASLLGSNPDGRIDGEHLLEKGECGFSYILGAAPGQWGRPLLVAPLIPGTIQIDPGRLKGAVIIVRVDGSVQLLKSGFFLKTLFDPENPIWEGTPPVIAWPDL